MENAEHNVDDQAKLYELMVKESWSLPEALRSKTFWMVGLMSMIVPMFSTGITFHWIQMMAERSVSRTEAAIVVGLIALPFAVMPFIARPLIDKVPVRRVFFLTLSMIMISMVWLAFFVYGIVGAILFILFYGLAVSIQSVALNVLWPDYFGRRYLGSIRGAATVFMVIGTALGPLPFGVIYDITGSFVPTILGMMAMTFMAMILVIFIKKPEKAN